MSKEELLAEAKKRYKIGDTIDQRPAYGCGGVYTLDSLNTSVDFDNKKWYVIVGGYGVYCHSKNAWATIVSDSKLKLNYLIL